MQKIAHQSWKERASPKKYKKYNMNRQRKFNKITCIALAETEAGSRAKTNYRQGLPQ